MKRIHILLLGAVLALTSCQESADQQAAPLLSEIEQLYEQGHYQQALDSITALRTKYPKAVESRKRALKIWQNASLRMTQDDIGRTDSALQAVTKQWQAATTIRDRNLLKAKKDSLQIRYDALCGTVRVIHKRQEQN